MVSLAYFHFHIIRVTATMMTIKIIEDIGITMTMMKILSFKTMTITKEHLDSLPPQEEAPAEEAEELKFCFLSKKLFGRVVQG